MKMNLPRLVSAVCVSGLLLGTTSLIQAATVTCPDSSQVFALYQSALSSPTANGSNCLTTDSAPTCTVNGLQVSFTEPVTSAAAVGTFFRSTWNFPQGKEWTCSYAMNGQDPLGVIFTFSPQEIALPTSLTATSWYEQYGQGTCNNPTSVAACPVEQN